MCLTLAAVPGAAQAPAPPCHVLCDPAFSVFPALNRSPIANAPRVESLSDGSVHRIPAANNFQVTLVAAAKTPLPRIGVVGSLQWLPTAQEAANPYTRYSASELQTSHLRANAPTATFAVTGALLRAKETGGWLALGAQAGDLFSQAQRPNDQSSYTHKLDLELVANAYLLAALPHAVWAHGVSVTAVLDRVVTGLPHAGDEIPRGERRFLDTTRPFTLVLGLSLPLVSSTP